MKNESVLIQNDSEKENNLIFTLNKKNINPHPWNKEEKS